LVFTSLDHGDPQRGVSLNEVRTVLPIMDKFEEQSTKTAVPGGERVVFNEQLTLSLKESEFNTLTSKLEGSAGWASASVVRKVIRLLDRLKETTKEPDAPESRV
jgi:hypothetical protein